GIKLGIKQTTFLNKLVQVTKDTLIFDINVKKVADIIKIEEDNFSKTIRKGKKILDDEMKKTKDYFNVDVAFKLFETYGFPIEMTNDILNENNIKLDLARLQLLKEKHSLISKANKEHNHFEQALNSLNLIDKQISDFIGYDSLTSRSKILFLLDEKEKVEDINGVGYLVLDKTPFYATSGGQLHDKGYLIQAGNKIEIIDVFKDKNNNHIHKVKGKINAKNYIDAFVDEKTRIGLMRNHSATHLLFAALRKLYGDQIIQLGSDNNQDRLTFDFPLKQRPTEKEIKAIEDFINNIIKKNIIREYIITTTTKAKKMGAIMTIEEMEYFNTENVRVVKFDDITTDLCGGTHIDETKNIEKFKIVSVDSKGSGIYRIRAISSDFLVDKYMNEQIKKQLKLLDSLDNKIINLDKTQRKHLIKPDNDLNKYLNNINGEIDKAKEVLKKLLKGKKISIDVELEPIKISNLNVYFSNNIDKEIIKNFAVSLREKSQNSLIVLLSKFEGQSVLVITSKGIDAKDIASKISVTKKIKGGGNSLIWQGVSLEEITFEDIKNLL
ncbi:MAG: alanine--tRNA ligase-related protein, partial [Metamycoplasmataceae bacterium]